MPGSNRGESPRSAGTELPQPRGLTFHVQLAQSTAYLWPPVITPAPLNARYDDCTNTTPTFSALLGRGSL